MSSINKESIVSSSSENASSKPQISLTLQSKSSGKKSKERKQQNLTTVNKKNPSQKLDLAANNNLIIVTTNQNSQKLCLDSEYIQKQNRSEIAKTSNSDIAVDKQAINHGSQKNGYQPPILSQKSADSFAISEQGPSSSMNRESLSRRRKYLSPSKEHKEEIEGTNLGLTKERRVSSMIDKSILEVRLSKLPTQNPICSIHSNILSIFCIECELQICSECSQMKVHFEHKMEPIDQFLEHQKFAWCNLLQEQRFKVRSIMQNVDYATWENLDQELQQLTQNPSERQKQVLFQLDEIENSITRMLSQHNIKELLIAKESTAIIQEFNSYAQDDKKQFITQLMKEFTHDVNSYKSLLYFNQKLQKSQQLESELKDLISKELDDLRSESKQDLEFTTNKLIQLESDILPQIEEHKKSKSSNDILTLKKNQSEIVSTIEELIKIKNKNEQELKQIKELQGQIKIIVFDFEQMKKQVDNSSGIIKNIQNQLSDLKILELKISQVEKDLGLEKLNFHSLKQSINEELKKEIDNFQVQLNNNDLKLQQQVDNKFNSQEQLMNDQLKTLKADIKFLIDQTDMLDQKQGLLDIFKEQTNNKIMKVQEEFQQYFNEERERKRCSWEIESGEEAQIKSQLPINTILQLSNQLLVASTSMQSSSNYLLEIFNAKNDYDPIRTISTFHSQVISCMIEHNKVLLTGSYDYTIGLWDIYNNFQMLKQYTLNNDESVTCLLSIDNRYFISACSQGSLKIWDSLNHNLTFNKHNSHQNKINSVEMMSKFRLVTCSNDKNATIWQLQGSDMQQIKDLPHNSFVVAAQQLTDSDHDSVLTLTIQGYLFIWNLCSQSGNPETTLKIDCKSSALSCLLMKDYHHQLFPFLLVRCSNEIFVVQITTGKAQKIKIRMEDTHSLNDIEKYAEQRKIVQIDSQHILVVDGYQIRVLLIEFENLKDAILT